MSVLTLMESSGVLFVFLPVRLDVAKASRPKITTASSCVNTDILVLDNLSNVLLGIFMPPPKEIYFDHRRKNIVLELWVWINDSALIIHTLNMYLCIQYVSIPFLLVVVPLLLVALDSKRLKAHSKLRLYLLAFSQWLATLVIQTWKTLY